MRKLSGFSLMEMMVVLLVTAVVAAASAPMINKKLTGDLAAENSCPWIYTGTNNSIAYNIKNGDKTVSIGAQKAPEMDPRVYIKTDLNSPHILLDDTSSNATYNDSGHSAHLSFTYNNGAVILSTYDTGSKNSVLIGRAAGYYDESAISIGHGAGAGKYSVAIGSLGTDNSSASATGTDSVAIGRAASSTYSAVAIGSEASANDNAIAIGSNRKYGTFQGNLKTVAAKNSIAIGTGAIAGGENAVAIGNTKIAATGGTTIGKNYAAVDSVAIGTAQALGEASIAIGRTAYVSREISTAIGAGAVASHQNSTAIGAGATTTASNQIVLGTASDTVYIPGKLVVDRSVMLARGYEGDKKPTVYVGGYDRDDSGSANGDWQIFPINSGDDDYGNSRLCTYKQRWDSYQNNNVAKWTTETTSGTRSDRRLKDVGKAFTGGLEEVKKLEVFNYTFKDDKSKTPRVGVMAQDLEKIFPKAVTKGDDGFLRIRMEDMFYAVVNAVKELDNRLSLLEQKQKRIDELEERLDKLEKKLEKLEKKMK